jgi:hypothetical protein
MENPTAEGSGAPRDDVLFGKGHTGYTPSQSPLQTPKDRASRDVSSCCPVDLFGNQTLIGVRLRLNRDIDRRNPCHENICIIFPGKGPHAGELICASCHAHRGWLSRTTYSAILAQVQRCGIPPDPIVVEDLPVRDFTARQIPSDRQQ